MHPSNPSQNQQLWSSLSDASGGDESLLDILRGLVDRYAGMQPAYIGAYELESVVVQLGYRKEEKWKRLVDYLCFETKLLDLKFRLIDGDDHYEISYEDLQSVMAGEYVTFGKSTYSDKALQNNIFPYFVPTEPFYQLLGAERAQDA